MNTNYIISVLSSRSNCNLFIDVFLSLELLCIFKFSVNEHTFWDNTYYCLGLFTKENQILQQVQFVTNKENFFNIILDLKRYANGLFVMYFACYASFFISKSINVSTDCLQMRLIR
jgi:hypothetical protein